MVGFVCFSRCLISVKKLHNHSLVKDVSPHCWYELCTPVCFELIFRHFRNFVFLELKLLNFSVKNNDKSSTSAFSSIDVGLKKIVQDFGLCSHRI